MNAKTTIIFLFLLNQLLFSQNKDSTVFISAGIEYESGWFHNIFFGSHWRNVWTEPLSVKVLDLDKFAGGIRPIKKGGGFQTKSLRFKGNDGHYWKFRSIEKDPSKTLPEALRESIAADILQDQISSSNPYAAFVVEPILKSLNVLQAEPFLYYMPDSEKLGEFRDEFGNMLGIMEIHPDVDEEEDIYFGGADKVKGTLDLFERLEEERDEKVNSLEYLKARLIDIFLGDWDRHTDQWKWARFKNDDKKLWLPIPRDRDQAFAKFDGLLVALAAYIIPQFNHFGHSFQNIQYLTWNGRFVDRHFLSEITKSEWDSVTVYVKEKLTDDLIKYSVKKFPEEIYPLAVEEVETKLKSRRDQLTEISDEYYEFINTVVDIYCSDKDDYVEIIRLNDELTEVQLFKKEKKTDSPKGRPLYSKTFNNSITDEIRIYLNKGDDKVFLSGTADDGILIRIIGGKGKDEIIDSSKVNGYFLSITPFAAAENKTMIYDSGDKTKIFSGPGTTLDNHKIDEPETQEERYRPLQKDRSSELYFYPILNYSTDNGFIIGGGPLYYKYGFRAVPNQFEILFTAHYATEPKNGAIHLETQFNTLIKNAALKIDIDATGLEFTKYYGYGNESPYDSELEDDEYYQLEEGLFAFRPSVQFNLSKNLTLTTGVSYIYSNSELENELLLYNFPYGKYGIGKLNLINTNVQLEIDTRDNMSFAQSGFYTRLFFNYYPKLLDNKENFGRGLFDVRGYATSNLITETTFAFRAYGEKVWGKFPFLAAAFLGGTRNLISYTRERFSGNASLYGSIQMRMKIARIKLLINGNFGFHLFGETGRVYTPNNNSKKWHPGFGGGFWISYLEKMLNIVVTFAHSRESDLIYFGFGFNF